MATNPAMDSEDPTMDPAAGEAQEPPEGHSSDYVIEIKVSGQGIQVGVESADDEMKEEQGAGEGGSDEENYQTVQSIGEACRLIRQIYAHAGAMQDSGADQAAMEQGYGK